LKINREKIREKNTKNRQKMADFRICQIL